MAESETKNDTAINFDAATPEERKKFKLWCMEHNVSMREYLQTHIDYNPDPKKLMEMM
jgi:hypothetical protein